MVALVDHGIPVVSLRQWGAGISPNAAGGWNYIVQIAGGPVQSVQNTVIKDLTGTPVQVDYFTPNHHFAGFGPFPSQQLRAANGRIFWPLVDLYTSYYDPTTESIGLLGPIVEIPPVTPGVSTGFYATMFDTTGHQLYFGTYESQNRPVRIVCTDTDTLTQTTLGQVGDSATQGGTYAYYIAVDTITAAKFVYVVYGETTWQLWALNITSGAAAKLYEVPTTGAISFQNIAGQGWIANIHSHLGGVDDVLTHSWCLDGALYPYTNGVAPPLAARNVTPASNPLVNAPDLDVSGGAGVIGWRPHGSSAPYTYVDYAVANATPQAIESLVATPDGVLGNALNYQGFFRAVSGGTVTWFGSEVGLVNVSQGPRINVNGTVYIAGYPDGVLYRYNPAAAWQGNVLPTVNPALLGYYGPSGNSIAGTKYASVIAWAPGAGVSGRLYCAGVRERDGTGGGIGYWDKTANTFAGTFAPPLDTIQPSGLVALNGSDGIRIVMATGTLSGVGTAPIYVFDPNLNIVSTQTPIAAAKLGALFPTSDPDVVCGVMTLAGAMVVFRHNVHTNTLLTSIVTAYVGVDCACINPDGSIWAAAGNALVRIDPNTLVVTNILDVTSIAPVGCMSFFGAGTELYLSSAANLWSVNFASAQNNAIGRRHRRRRRRD